MTTSTAFAPRWASPPGATISEYLRQNRIPVTTFAKSIGRSPDVADKLLTGDEAIDVELAEDLHRAIGGSVAFWLNRENQFRGDLARLESERLLQSAQDWVRELPLRDMVKYGWIASHKDKQDQIAACLNFFNVPNVGAWEKNYRAVANVVAFRTSAAFEAHPGAVAAWLRRGEIIAEGTRCRPWDKSKLRDKLGEMRSLTRKKDPAVFLPELRRLCAECGVAVVVARAPTGCRASGATRFLTEDKALVLLSFRYRTDDHFWFTFFHEIGHLLLHDKQALFVEGEGMHATHEEDEADQFAGNLLISPEQKDEMFELRLEYRSLMRFARKIGVSPGVVVGQLQHHQRLESNKMNFLKVRYVWGDG